MTLTTLAPVNTREGQTLSANQIKENYKRVGKEMLWIPATLLTRATTNPPAVLATLESSTNKVNIQVLDFDGTTAEITSVVVAMPKQWDEGTVTYQVYWTGTATDTDGVAWSVAGVSFADSDAQDTAYGTAVEVVDAHQSVSGDIYISSESAAVTIAGTPAAGELVVFKISRNPANSSDTAAEDARLIGIKIFWTSVAPGTND